MRMLSSLDHWFYIWVEECPHLILAQKLEGWDSDFFRNVGVNWSVWVCYVSCPSV